jgi:hypothetical protein
VKYLILLVFNIFFSVSAITDIMTCKRILVQSHERTSPQFTAVLYAVVSKFNVDGLIPLIFNKWQVFYF